MPDLKVMNSIGYMAQATPCTGSSPAEENLGFFRSMYGMKKPGRGRG
jgi:ABC-type multidrug transport system ATPase subunit